MNHPFLALLVRWSVLALGVTLATKLIDGIHYDTLSTLLVVVVLLSLFNAVLKPILVLFGLPFIVLTLGIGMLFINALLFSLVGRIVHGFTVETFWDALLGALIVSLTNLFISVFIGGKKRVNVSGSVNFGRNPSVSGGPARGPANAQPVNSVDDTPASSSAPRKIKSDDVIDI